MRAITPQLNSLPPIFHALTISGRHHPDLDDTILTTISSSDAASCAWPNSSCAWPNFSCASTNSSCAFQLSCRQETLGASRSSTQLLPLTLLQPGSFSQLSANFLIFSLAFFFCVSSPLVPFLLLLYSRTSCLCLATFSRLFRYLRAAPGPQKQFPLFLIKSTTTFPPFFFYYSSCFSSFESYPYHFILPSYSTART